MMHDGSEGEDADESSSDSSTASNGSPLSTMAVEFNTALDEFRDKWQRELLTNVAASDELTQTRALHIPLAIDKKAEQFFLRGVELEKQGKVYDALEFYRKAVQLDPDVELKFYESNKKKSEKNNNQPDLTNDNDEKEKDDNNAQNTSDKNNDEEDLTGIDLYVRFQQFLMKNEYLIQRANEPGVVSTGRNFSDLPTELILYILKWVVSSHLDITSLENFATACKGFYLCARDDEIWHLICLKVWGSNTGPLINTQFKSWREMFIERHRVQFNGCYISKTKYLRYGETNFRDQFYRPVQLIEYFRYFRFYPDHSVLMWTTAEEPAVAVTKLKNINQLRPEILRGHYRIHGDIVSIMLKKYHKDYIANLNKWRGAAASDEAPVYTYYIEFKILSTPKRRFAQLQWKNYSMIQIKSASESTNDFDLSTERYPALWFSRVKSYHLEADSPLQ